MSPRKKHWFQNVKNVTLTAVNLFFYVRIFLIVSIEGKRLNFSLKMFHYDENYSNWIIRIYNCNFLLSLQVYWTLIFLPSWSSPTLLYKWDDDDDDDEIIPVERDEGFKIILIYHLTFKLFHKNPIIKPWKIRTIIF